MDFYEGIAEYYDHIFPLRKERVDFASSLAGSGGRDILDTGCATGGLALALAEAGHRVTGIDLDPGMIDRGRQKAREKPCEPAPRFECLDMLEVGRFFAPGSFDLVCCFGNTLPHLQGLPQVSSFCAAVFSNLKPGGRFLVQAVNFQPSGSQKILTLPTIDNPFIRFERSYEWEGDRVFFDGLLHIEESGQTVQNRVALYPLAPTDLERVVRSAGFDEVRFAANEQGAPFTPGNRSYIMIAMKKPPTS